MKKPPKISVCIPCFNEEKYIKQAIESVLAQTYSNFVLYVIDNNSTDKTLDIVKGIKDKRIFIHKNKTNIGMYGNINKCLEIAESNYIKILCADDLLEKNCLKKQINIFIKHLDVVLVYGASNVINPQGKIIFKRFFLPVSTKTDGNLLIKKILKSARNPLGEPSNIMFRKEIAISYNIVFDESLKYIADIDMWIKLLMHGKGYYLNETISSFRLHKSSGTAILMKGSIKEHLELMQKYQNRFKFSIYDRLMYKSKLIIFMFLKILVFKIFSK